MKEGQIHGQMHLHNTKPIFHNKYVLKMYDIFCCSKKKLFRILNSFQLGGCDHQKCIRDGKAILFV